MSDLIKLVDGEFFVSRTAFRRALRRGAMFGGIQTFPVLRTDPDAFMPHGSEHALDRWADDGGPA